MHRYIKKLIALSLSTVFWSAQLTPALAMDPILPHKDVREGMVGTAYTVIDSSGELRDFQVDIIGNTGGDAKGAKPMIMAKASGPVVESVGGILQGMSGSPVYVNGYLIGAVAAGIKEMTPYTFFITPIDEMTPLWKMPDHKNKTRIRTVDVKKVTEERKKKKEALEKERAERIAKGETNKVYGDELIDKAKAAVKADETLKRIKAENHAASEKKAENAKGEDAKTQDVAGEKTAGKTAGEKAEPKSVLYFSGFNQAGLNFLQKQVDPDQQYTFLPMGSVSDAAKSKTEYDAKLVPGSSVGVAVVYGDFSVGATGTVTAVDGKKILAFGHPFLHRGNVNYFMTGADIVGTISGQSNGMKIANMGNIIGRINQDRATGIAGNLGTFPSVVPIKVKVKDVTLGREDSYGARIAYDEDFLAKLSGGIAYGALSKTTDDLSGSTVEVGFAIRTNAVPNGKVERRNMFYNVTDPGQTAMLELIQAMNLVCTNTDIESDIIDVQVDIQVEDVRKTASLISAVPDKTKVKPGDTVKFTTTIKPYRKAKETLIIPFTVPENQPDGALALDIRGGGLVPVTAISLLQQSGVQVTTENEKKKTTADKLKTLQESGRNNEVIIAPTPGQQELTNRQRRQMLEASRKKIKKVTLLDSGKKDKAGETKFVTKYVIDNVIHSTLQVSRK